MTIDEAMRIMAFISEDSMPSVRLYVGRVYRVSFDLEPVGDLEANVFNCSVVDLGERV